MSKNKANEFVEHAINTQSVKIVDNYFPAEALFFMSFENRMSFTDICCVSIAFQNNCELITFDKDQLRFYNKFKKKPKNC